MTDAELQNIATARSIAKSLADMAIEDASSVPPYAVNAYWDELRDRIGDKIEPKRSDNRPNVKPMTLDESISFERSMVPYGKYCGKQVVDVLNGGNIEYFDWLIGQKDEFKEKCERYMISERGRARMIGIPLPTK